MTGSIWIVESDFSPYRGIKRGATIETEPAEPNEDSADEDDRHVVWFVVVLLTILLALAKNKSVSKASGPGRDVNRPSSGKVKGAQLEEPSVGVPSPVGNWAVADSTPTKAKDD